MGNAQTQNDETETEDAVSQQQESIEVGLNDDIEKKDMPNTFSGDESTGDTMAQRKSVPMDPVRSDPTRPETKRFIETVRNFFACRESLNSKYLEMEDELKMIANHPIQMDSGGIETGPDELLQFKSEYQQQSLSKKPVEMLDELFSAAKMVQPVFQSLIDKTAKKVCKECGCHVSDVDVVYNFFKRRHRALEKAEYNYTKRKPEPAISWLYDIVRVSINFTTAEQVLKFIDLLQKDETVHIVKAKNRFKNPSFTGYRDLLVFIQIGTPFFKHICEIQIHHRVMKCLENDVNGHEYYETFRSFFSGPRDELEEYLDDLRTISNYHEKLDDSYFNNFTNQYRLKRLADLLGRQSCQYNLSLRAYDKLLEIQLTTSGTNESLDVGETCQGIGWVMYKQGRLDAAISMYEKAIESFKSIVGEEHPAVAGVYHKIGTTLYRKGLLQDAMIKHQQSLDIYKISIGENHLSAATAYNNMGLILGEQDKIEEALMMYKKALNIYTDSIGDDHMSAAETYNNMGNLLGDHGDLEEAMKMLQISLKIKKKNLGEIHVSVADTYNNYGFVLEDQGKPEEAMELYEKALVIYKKSRGEVDLSVAETYNNIASLLCTEGKLDEALSMYQESLKIKKLKMGEEHPLVAEMYCNIASALVRQNKSEKALEMYKKSLRIFEKLPREMRASKSFIYNNMAGLLRGMGKIDDAMSLLHKLFEIERKAEDGSSIGQTHSNLGAVLLRQGKFEEATGMFEKSLEIKKKSVGEDHFVVAETYSNLAIVLKEQGKLNEGLRMYEKSLEIKKCNLGEDHSSVGETYYDMALLLRTQGKPGEALDIALRAVEIFKKALEKEEPHAMNSATENTRTPLLEDGSHF
jgi:tetratricopeptide (TPR) repeat protein